MGADDRGALKSVTTSVSQVSSLVLKSNTRLSMGSKMKPVLYSEVVSEFLLSGEDSQLPFGGGIEVDDQKSFFLRAKTKFIKSKKPFKRNV